jgi:hypothetical protein
MHDLNVFPNPANDKVNVGFTNDKYQKMTIELISVTGEQLFSETSAISPGRVNRCFTTASLTKGIYFLRIMSEREVAIRKIIIE